MYSIKNEILNAVLIYSVNHDSNIKQVEWNSSFHDKWPAVKIKI